MINDGVFFLNCRKILLRFLIKLRMWHVIHGESLVLTVTNFVGDRFVCCCEDSMGNFVNILVNIAVRLDFFLKD